MVRLTGQSRKGSPQRCAVEYLLDKQESTIGGPTKSEGAIPMIYRPFRKRVGSHRKDRVWVDDIIESARGDIPVRRVAEQNRATGRKPGGDRRPANVNGDKLASGLWCRCSDRTRQGRHRQRQRRGHRCYRKSHVK